MTFLEERWLSPETAQAETDIGPVERWQADGLVASREAGDADPAVLSERVRKMLSDERGPMAQAIESVHPEADSVVVRFQPPDALEVKTVSGRLVECLLY